MSANKKSTRLYSSSDQQKQPKIYIIRHGITDFNFRGRIQGNLDSKLTQEGIETTEKIANVLKMELNNEPVQILCSPLLRTIQTAQILSKYLGVQYKTDDRAIELNRGILEGLSKKHLSGDLKKYYDDFKKDPWHFRVPMGETFFDLKLRCEQFFMNIKSSDINKIVVTHGYVVRMLIGIATGNIQDVNADEIPHRKIFVLNFHDKHYSVTSEISV